jgi:hypothetical protein
MRKKLLVLALLAGTLSAQADEYPYLIFETTDGSRTPVEVESLTIQIVDGNLVADGKTFSLTSLSKMFFATTPDATSGIEDLRSADSGAVEVYSLNGMSLGSYNNVSEAKQSLQRGIYVIKSGSKTFKVAVK